jgi:hypothetical protein
LDEGEQAEYVVLDLDPTSTKSPLGFHAFYEQVSGWLEYETYGVVAQRGGTLLLRRGAPRENLPSVLSALDEYGRDFYRVTYLGARLPARLRAGELYRASIVVRNAGPACWSSQGQLPVRLSYRWLADGDPLLSVSSLRTNLPHQVEPGHMVRLRAWLLAPAQPGSYTLEWDIVREGDAWFGDVGSETLRQVVTVW